MARTVAVTRGSSLPRPSMTSSWVPSRPRRREAPRRSWVAASSSISTLSSRASRWTLTRLPVRKVAWPNMAVERLTLT
jgi:hypothetical protein